MWLYLEESIFVHINRSAKILQTKNHLEDFNPLMLSYIAHINPLFKKLWKSDLKRRIKGENIELNEFLEYGFEFLLLILNMNA